VKSSLRWPILGLLLAVCPGLLLAEDACSGGYHTKAAKIPGSTLVLKLSAAKGAKGNRLLQWPAPGRGGSTLIVAKAKGPMDAHGKIQLCASARMIMLFGPNSISLQDLQRSQSLIAGYYGVRVVFPDVTSDWIVIQIQPPPPSTPNPSP
jgi:hypothetical protein